MKKIKRVVILGSGGFISSSIENELNKKKINFLGLTRKKIDLLKNSSVNKLNNILKKTDVVIIIAAKAPCKNLKMLEDNLQIMRNILKALSKKSLKKVLYLSSDAVYSDSMKKINEKSKTNPNNFHGLMHLIREKMLLSLNLNNLCILRPTLVYGKNDPHNGYGPNSFLRLAKKNVPIKIFGNGEELRDHVHVDDVAKIISISILKNFVGELNIVTGTKISFYQIAKLAIKRSKSSSKIIKIKRKGPMPHNGYRLFNASAIKKYFKEVKLKNIKYNKLYN
ncbi:NAD-dependent epimerase/dehydratase family protein [Candidatus Pelagibacter sp.]|nr:NAD-dependent epimerase/dehydratase family protein [Candidatus Pelagibacter sp.]